MLKIDAALDAVSGAWMGMLALAVFALLFVQGCAPHVCEDAGVCGDDAPLGADGNGEAGGSNLSAIQMPFAAGDERMCVQGAFGTYSHAGKSTKYDLDLDTSNSAVEEVFAPVGGVARVHLENASTNFGYHVNIDQGDGHYIVVAHLSSVIVQDGDEVSPGQLLGFEGCTGACQGDHVHIGRHKGDARLMAQFGESVPVAYWSADATLAGGFAARASEDFVCGIKAMGDPHDGHFYESGSAVALWHPDGTLVKTPDNARTYLVEGGQARWIDNEATFWSHHYDFADTVLISSEELACLREGPDIDREGEIRAAFDENTDELWLGVTGPDGERSRVRVHEEERRSVLKSWGIDRLEDVPVLGGGDTFWRAYPAFSGTAKFRDGTLLKERGESAVYAVSKGIALPVKDWDTYLLMGLQGREIIEIYDGALDEIMPDAVGDCRTGAWCLDREAITTCGGGLDLGEGESGGSQEEQDQEREEEERDDGAGENEESHENDNDAPPTQDTQEPQDEEDTAMDDQDPDAERNDAPDRTETPPMRQLDVRWTAPFSAVAERITLSGEYRFADGSYGFTWRELKSVEDASAISYELDGASAGDRFRFSVEYVDQQGNVSWSCIGPFPPGTRQGRAEASADGGVVPVDEVGDPSGQTTGCGLIVTVP